MIISRDTVNAVGMITCSVIPIMMLESTIIIVVGILMIMISMSAVTMRVLIQRSH